MNSITFVTDITTHLTGATPVVSVVEDETGAIITVSPHGNVSALIGKSGTTIDAIRVLCKAVGYKDKHRVKIKIDESHKDQL